MGKYISNHKWYRAVKRGIREANKQRRRSSGKYSLRTGETPDEWIWRQPWKIKLPIIVGLLVLIVVVWETGLFIPLFFIVLLLWFIVTLFL